MIVKTMRLMCWGARFRGRYLSFTESLGGYSRMKASRRCDREQSIVYVWANRYVLGILCHPLLG